MRNWQTESSLKPYSLKENDGIEANKFPFRKRNQIVFKHDQNKCIVMLHYTLIVSIFFIQTKIAKIKKKKENKMTTFMHAVAVKETHQTYEPPSTIEELYSDCSWLYDVQTHLTRICSLQFNLNPIKFPLESVLGACIHHLHSHLRCIRRPVDFRHSSLDYHLQ